MQTSIKEWAVSYKRTAFTGALVALAILGDSFLYAALPVHYREAGVSLIMVGWLLSLNRWVRLFTNAVAGWLGSCLGWNTVFTAALWLTVITTFGYGRTGSVPILLLLRGLWGLCWSLLRLGGQAAVLAECAWAACLPHGIVYRDVSIGKLGWYGSGWLFGRHSGL